MKFGASTVVPLTLKNIHLRIDFIALVENIKKNHDSDYKISTKTCPGFRIDLTGPRPILHFYSETGQKLSVCGYLYKTLVSQFDIQWIMPLIYKSHQ